MTTMQTVKMFAAVLICTCGIVGCNREESAASKLNPASPESYMNDPKFQAQLEVQDAAKREVLKTYAELKARYAAALKADPNGAETQSLKARLLDLEIKFQEIRKQTAKIVGDRLRAPKAKGNQ